MAWLLVATGFAGALALRFWWSKFSHVFRTPPSVVVSFSPRGACLDVIVGELMAARKEILVQAHSIPADAITNALVEAKKRGVEVGILLDRRNEQQPQSGLRSFLDKGLTPLIDSRQAAAYAQIMIIDRKTIITGSYDFTSSAESENAENLLIIKGHPELAHSYYKNYESHKAQSQAPNVKPTAVPSSTPTMPLPATVPPTVHKKAG